MKEQPIVSVIIQVKNTGKYINKCLDSIISQTLKIIEIIVVDDNSKENILQYISFYLEDPRINYIKLNQTAGPGGARNKGLEIAKGQYIGFCDSDDWIDIDYFQQAVSIMDASEADIGMFSLIRENDINREPRFYRCLYKQFIELSSDIAIKIMTGQLEMGLKVTPHCTNKIYRKDFLEKHHLSFKEHITSQDVLFAFQTFLQANKIICVPNTKYHHYKRPQSIVQSFDEKYIHDLVILFTSIRTFLKEQNAYERYCFNYYKLLDRFVRLNVQKIFAFVSDDSERKKYMQKLLKNVKTIIDIDEYFEYTNAEDIRNHLMPNPDETLLY